MDEIQQTHNPQYLYSKQLAINIRQAHPELNVSRGHQHIYIGKSGNEPDLKQWLYSLLEKLPEIDHPRETIHFIIAENDSIELMTVINPSEFTIRAEEYAIESGLNFSQPPGKSGYSTDPLPLDHPWYSDKDYFKKQPKKKSLFDQIKDRPDVKAILDDFKEKGYLDQ